MNDKLLDTIFDPKIKEAFRKRLASPSKTQTDIQCRVNLYANFGASYSQTLKKLPADVIKFASQYKIEIEKETLEIHFHSPESWEKKGHPLLNSSKLPGAHAQLSTNPPLVTIIVQPQQPTFSHIINITRLICFEIYGNIFFRETVPRRYPYFQESISQKHLEITLAEKSSLSRFLDIKNNKFKKIWEEIGTKNGAKLTPQTLGRRIFYESLMGKTEEHSGEFNQIIEEWFKHFINEYYENQQVLYELMQQKILQVIPKTACLFQHEKEEFLESKGNQADVMRRLMDRLGQLSSLGQALCSFIQYYRLHQERNKYKPDNEDQEPWKNILKHIKNTLENSDLAYNFLLPEKLMDQEKTQKKEMFLLWLYQNVVLKHFPSRAQNNKILVDIRKNYEETYMQKMYSGTTLALLMLEKPDLFEEELLQQEMQTVFSRILLDTEILGDAFAGIIFISQHPIGSSPQSPQPEKKNQGLEFFCSAWNYFISYTITREYLSELSIKNKYLEEKILLFQVEIEKILKKNTHTIPYLTLSSLFFKLYQERNNNIAEILLLLSEECPYLDSLIKRYKNWSQQNNDETEKLDLLQLNQWLDNKKLLLSEKTPE